MMVIRIPIFLAAFVTALIAGYKAGENLDPVHNIFNYQMDSMIMPGGTIPDNNQFNLLIISVDDIDQEDAQLESIWLAAHAGNTSNITLIPVFPSTDDPTQNLTLAESFYFDRDKPSKEFWDAMREINIWWKGYLISDITTSSKLIDFLGEIGINNQHLSGEQATGSVTSWKDDTTLAIQHQKIFFESICNRIAANPSTNLQAIRELFDREFRSNTQTKIFIAGWTTRAASNKKLTCTFPTLTQTPLQSTIISP